MIGDMGQWKDDALLQAKLSELVKNSYNQKEILQVVSSEFAEYSWSMRTLQRRLHYFRLKRNSAKVNPAVLVNIVKTEMKGTGRLLGYRALHRKIRNQHNLLVSRNDVYLAMNLVCPENLEARKLVNNKKRFRKRIFKSKGPNWVWSMDGHDKLSGRHKSEFPFGIHGCIDTFSRKVLWLKVWPSNCSPNLPAKLFLDAITAVGYSPVKTRSDLGSENVLVAAMQNFISNAQYSMSNHIFGSSLTNQVIEQWWKGFRERHGEFFKSQIHELMLTGLYDENNSTCRVVMAYIFIPLIQIELDDFVRNFNTHRIRKQDIYRPCGIPNFLFDYPELNGKLLHLKYLQDKADHTIVCTGGIECGIPIQLDRIKFLKKQLKLTNMRFIDSELELSLKDTQRRLGMKQITTKNAKYAYAILFSEYKNELLDFSYS